MSFKCMPLLVFGYAGTREYVGSCLRPFAEKHGIRQSDCTDSQLPLEILTEFKKTFTKNLKKSKQIIELMSEESYCTEFDYFFGFAWRHIGNVSQEEITVIQNNITDAFNKALEGIDCPTPTFNQVLWLY